MDNYVTAACLCLALVWIAVVSESETEFAVNSWNDDNGPLFIHANPIYTLDTKEDISDNWDIDSLVMDGYVYYADSATDIDTSLLNLTNTEDFNPNSFGDANGIWYFPHQLLFENSGNPLVLYATFNHTPPGIEYLKYVYIRYYLHGNTVLQVYRDDAVSENITSSDQVEGWEEILINLEELEMDPENNHTEQFFRLEFHTAERNVDYFLLDKVIAYHGDLPYTGPTTTTVAETTVTFARTTPGATQPSFTSESSTGTDDAGTEPTEEEPSTTIGAATKLSLIGFPFFELLSLLFVIYHL